jgi:hypothetical protein
MKIYESFDANTDVTGKFTVEPFEYEYIGNFKEVERILQHFEENGFEKVETGGGAFDDNGEKLWDQTVERDPFPSDKLRQVKYKILRTVDTPEGQRIEVR